SMSLARRECFRVLVVTWNINRHGVSIIRKIISSALVVKRGIECGLHDTAATTSSRQRHIHQLQMKSIGQILCDDDNITTSGNLARGFRMQIGSVSEYGERC